MPPRRNYIQKTTGEKVVGVTTPLGTVLNKAAIPWWAYRQGLDNYERLSKKIAFLLKTAKDGVVTTEKIEEIITTFEIQELYAKRDEAGDAGTLAHEFVENHLRGLPEPKTDLPQAGIDKAEGCYLSFLEWEKGHSLEVVDSEVALTSEQMPYGGTIDHVIRTARIAENPQAVEILDIKTGKDIYLEAKIQVSAYKTLWMEHHPDRPVVGLHILRLGPSGEYTQRFWPELDGYWPIFVDTLSIYTRIKALGEKL